MGIKHHYTKDYTIEQYSENTAVFLYKLPFDEDFDVEKYKKELKSKIRSIISGIEEIHEQFLIYVEKTTCVSEYVNRHNETVVEIYFKFSPGIKFKQKVNIIETFCDKIRG